ncbi:DUF1990 family protein [Candidatus Leptofilum sp.]|uniref:DUF1990 family protein n=1 Tax=Candidatus Leptofilum sp. TaxID=3241576 RepID=UPI003B599EED
MKLLTTAKLNWFDDGCCDVKYLDIWNSAPRSYQPGQPIDHSWQMDSYELPLGVDEDGRLFKKASDKLMRYQFYPHDVMSHVSDFGLWNRWVQAGDRIVQRIHLFSLFGKPILDAVTMTEVTQVILEPRRYGFTYVTVDTHVEQGEWSACLEWRKDNALILTVKATSRPRPEEPTRNYSFMRRLQQAAHQRGLEYFKQILLA